MTYRRVSQLRSRTENLRAGVSYSVMTPYLVSTNADPVKRGSSRATGASRTPPPSTSAPATRKSSGIPPRWACGADLICRSHAGLLPRAESRPRPWPRLPVVDSPWRNPKGAAGLKHAREPGTASKASCILIFQTFGAGHRPSPCRHRFVSRRRRTSCSKIGSVTSRLCNSVGALHQRDHDKLTARRALLHLRSGKWCSRPPGSHCAWSRLGSRLPRTGARHHQVLG